ncbi:MAG: arginine deiminase-related protein [Flavobacteriales bacterium]
MGQCASSVVLVRPTGFGYDPETAESNSFQRRSPADDVRRQAATEFDGLLDALRSAGVGVTVLDPFSADAPNAVFPNNWFSTDEEGNVVLYPMHTPSRRAERDPDLARTLAAEGFYAQRTIDLSGWEHKALILEGTGSLVLDRTHRKAFACISPRTTENALNAWSEQLGYTPIAFTATMDGSLGGQPVYHTNVVMSIGERFAVVCFEAMPYPAERQEVNEELEKSGREVIPITLEQMHHYVGNLLQLRQQPSPSKLALSGVEGPLVDFIFLSETAFLALMPEQRMALQRHGQLVPVAVPTIEAIGGGSVRCMLAENFLPLR